MVQELALRPAQPRDFASCQRAYFEGMAAIIEALKLDMTRHLKSFREQRQLAEVRLITVAGNGVGWVQTTAASEVIYLGQLYLEKRFQRQGIGSRVMRMVLDEAAREGKAVTLGVVKINPARWLHERLGFRVTHEDQHKLYMGREWSPARHDAGG